MFFKKEGRKKPKRGMYDVFTEEILVFLILSRNKETGNYFGMILECNKKVVKGKSRAIRNTGDFGKDIFPVYLLCDGVLWGRYV